MTLLEKVQAEFSSCLEKWSECNDSAKEIWRHCRKNKERIK